MTRKEFIETIKQIQKGLKSKANYGHWIVKQQNLMKKIILFYAENEISIAWKMKNGSLRIVRKAA